MTYREDFEVKKQEYLTDLKRNIIEIYNHKSNRRMTKQSIAEFVGMVPTEFARFIHTDGRGATDDRLKKLEEWVELHKLEVEL